MDEIKSHAADYFQDILGSTVLHSPPVSSNLQQNYLKLQVTAAEIKTTLFAMSLNRSLGTDGYLVEFIKA